jgi:hypothetical protein
MGSKAEEEANAQHSSGTRGGSLESRLVYSVRLKSRGSAVRWCGRGRVARVEDWRWRRVVGAFWTKEQGL